MIDDHKALISNLHNLDQLVQNFDISKLNSILEALEPSFLEHLEKEEKILEEQNMAKYWTLQEINEFKFI